MDTRETALPFRSICGRRGRGSSCGGRDCSEARASGQSPPRHSSPKTRSPSWQSAFHLCSSPPPSREPAPYIETNMCRHHVGSVTNER